MFAAIRNIFLKGGDIKDAIAYVFKATGNMPTKSEGMKIINIYQDVQKNTGKVIEFPKDKITPFHIPRPGEGIAGIEQRAKKIEALNEKLKKFTVKPDFSETMFGKDKTLLKDSPEAIAKIKADNKAAAERLRKKKMEEDRAKMEDRALEDYTDDPEGLASGGRVSLSNGGLANILGV